ncbi:MAG TPA: GatB/YqeY domain-containing protein [Candidatus Paceibacterota bacterium]|nr:GatB/YqeY domain-containing protein [Candidatus Paceibacterota bacterium]
MSLHEQIKNNIKESMKAGDKVRLEVMRGLVTAFTNELVATGKTPQDILTDEDAIKVITRLSKQRKDSIEQFTKGGRMDLVEEESKQLAILNEYLPKLMEKSEVEEFVKSKMAEQGAIDPTKKGMFMASLMKDLKGKADGGMVKEVVDKLFV